MTITRILSNALAFSKSGKEGFTQQLKKFEKVSAVMVTCVDSRVFPSRFLGFEPGDTFITRNPGNYIPKSHRAACNCSVLATLEIGCIRGNAEDILICGHSDCKAMHLLHEAGPTVIQQKSFASGVSSLDQWVIGNGMDTLMMFNCGKPVLQFKSNGTASMDLNLSLNLEGLEKLDPVDRLSQINVLQQMANVYSHPVLQDRLLYGGLNVHGIWFSLADACLHIYSRKQQAFVPVTDETLSGLLDEVKPSRLASLSG